MKSKRRGTDCPISDDSASRMCLRHTRVVSPRTASRGSGEERCIAYQEHVHCEHMWGNTFLAWVALYLIWKTTRANESTFGQSDFCPFARRNHLVSDWLSMVLWCDDSNPKWPGSQLMRITIFSPSMIVFLLQKKSFWCEWQATHTWRHAKNLVALHAVRRHDAKFVAPIPHHTLDLFHMNKLG